MPEPKAKLPAVLVQRPLLHLKPHLKSVAHLLRGHLQRAVAVERVKGKGSDRDCTRIR